MATSARKKPAAHASARRIGAPDGGAAGHGDDESDEQHPEHTGHARWANSMVVAPSADQGMMWPSQRGHWSPQPAPDSVARTTDPPRMTSTVKTSTPVASRRTSGVGGLR